VYVIGHDDHSVQAEFLSISGQARFNYDLPNAFGQNPSLTSLIGGERHEKRFVIGLKVWQLATIFIFAQHKMGSITVPQRGM